MFKGTVSILIFFALTILNITNLHSEELVLLDIPQNDGSSFPYLVELTKKCSFEGVTKISVPRLDNTDEYKSLMSKLTLLDRKINLMIDEYTVEPDRLIFSIKAAENMKFEFFFKLPECKLVRVLHYNNKQFNMAGLEIDYNTFLKSPVIEKIVVKSEVEANEDLRLYPWALRGQMSIYELSIGPALNVHTNIRINNQNKFEKNNPVVEPIPAFFFRYGPFFLNKNGVGSLLYTHNEFSVLGMGILEGEPYKSNIMEERTQGIFLGTILKYNLAEFTFYKDFFDKKGYNLKLNLAPEFYYKLSWKFSPQVFLQYWDDRYVDYYFGVKQQEALNNGLSPYTGKHTFNYGTMFEVMHFRDKWTFVGDIGVKMYGREVFESPTVSRNKEVRFITSVLYKFL